MTYKGTDFTPVPEFEELYGVSKSGLVYSVRSRRVLHPTVYNTGYQYVTLSKNGEQKRTTVHRLVAETFIPKECGRTQVNHKDENRQNNSVDNLEWVTCKENINHGSHNERSAKKKRKNVICVETGETFDSVEAAAKSVNRVHTAITNTLRNRSSTCGGYHWKYI